MPKQPKQIWEESPYSQELRGLLRPTGPVGGLDQMGLLGPQGGLMPPSPEGIAGRQKSLMGAFDQITGGMNRLSGMMPTQYPTYRDLPTPQPQPSMGAANLQQRSEMRPAYNRYAEQAVVDDGGVPLSYDEWLWATSPDNPLNAQMSSIYGKKFKGVI